MLRNNVECVGRSFNPLATADFHTYVASRRMSIARYTENDTVLSQFEFLRECIETIEMWIE